MLEFRNVTIRFIQKGNTSTLQISNTDKKTVLISGAHGFLGRYCAAEFASKGYRVVGIGHGTWQDFPASSCGVELWLEGDVTLARLAELTVIPDVIVHAAGSGSVGFSLSHPQEDFARSVDTTVALLEYARSLAIPPQVLLLSSAAVYGRAESTLLTTDMPLQPTSPYGVHKGLAEQLCASYRTHFGIPASIIRFFSVYGEGLRKQLLWEACRRMGSAVAGEALEFFGTGTETRDWLYAGDAARLVRLVAEHAECGMIVNGGTGHAVCVREVLTQLAAALQWQGEIHFNGIVRPGDPEHLCADISGSNRLGWQPLRSLHDGLTGYANWFRSVS